MIEFYKKRGETPLEALNRLREEKPELTGEVLSYAGRLDPMAEGVLLVLVGDENKERQKFLGKDKEYKATFLIGCESDTGDVLGVICRTDFKWVDENKIKEAVESFVQIKQQTYPWYSSKTVEGIPLFEYARKKIFDIVRPARDVEIYSIEDIKVEETDFYDLREEIIEDIQKVKGDFRQGEIIESWNKIAAQASPAPQSTLVSCTLKVSSGTYIRSLAEYLGKELNRPVILYRLVRTRIF